MGESNERFAIIVPARCCDVVAFTVQQALGGPVAQEPAFWVVPALGVRDPLVVFGSQVLPLTHAPVAVGKRVAERIPLPLLPQDDGRVRAFDQLGLMPLQLLRPDIALI